MTEIKIQKREETKEGWLFEVEVNDGGSATHHQVTLLRSYYQELIGKLKEPLEPEELVKKSFEFLLSRESKESILSAFSLEVINKYFPEYENKIKDYL